MPSSSVALAAATTTVPSEQHHLLRDIDVFLVEHDLWQSQHPGTVFYLELLKKNVQSYAEHERLDQKPSQSERTITNDDDTIRLIQDEIMAFITFARGGKFWIPSSAYCVSSFHNKNQRISNSIVTNDSKNEQHHQQQKQQQHTRWQEAPTDVVRQHIRLTLLQLYPKKSVIRLQPSPEITHRPAAPSSSTTVLHRPTSPSMVPSSEGRAGCRYNDYQLMDVLIVGSKSKLGKTHVGNCFYQDLVDERCDEYEQADRKTDTWDAGTGKRDRPLIVSEIIAFVTFACGGKFLRRRKRRQRTHSESENNNGNDEGEEVKEDLTNRLTKPSVEEGDLGYYWEELPREIMERKIRHALTSRAKLERKRKRFLERKQKEQSVDLVGDGQSIHQGIETLSSSARANSQSLISNKRKSTKPRTTEGSHHQLKGETIQTVSQTSSGELSSRRRACPNDELVVSRQQRNLKPRQRHLLEPEVDAVVAMISLRQQRDG